MSGTAGPYGAHSARTEPARPEPGASSAPTYRTIAHQELIDDYRIMCTARALDERQVILHKQGRTFFQIDGAGHEALLSALARSLRPGSDWFFPYYRDLTLMLALGVSPLEVLLGAVGSGDDPASGGRQMPAHWGNRRLHIVSQSSPTGSQCLPAVGSAEASRYLLRHLEVGAPALEDEVTYASIGEGATSEGEFWESLNTATRLRLPVVYLVEDNGYAISVPAVDQAPAPISALVSAFPGLGVYRFDGGDYFAVRNLGAEAVARARSGAGPVLLHAKLTRPHSHSSSDNHAKYRPPAEIESDAARDPIAAFERELVSAGVLDAEGAAKIRHEAHDLVVEAASAALAASRPDPASVEDHLLALPRLAVPAEPTADGPPVHFGDAVRLTLAEVMEADVRVRVFGEDVADASREELEGYGGVFGTTHGLERRFGSDRCYNTPLAEANIVGRAVGQALRGLKPAPEIQFFDYIWPAMQQIRSELATTRWRSRSMYNLPVVLRCAIGGYVTGGAIWHSQCGESIFTHIPGLVVMFPSRARDAAGMLRAAFACDDPVLFLEHKGLYRQRHAMDPFPEPDYVVPIGKAATLRPGRDLTIVSWGATVHRSVLAAEQLAGEGVEVEVVDLRSLAPWDEEHVFESVGRTSRLLVVHEDVLTGGFGAEIAAVVAERCFAELDAPVRRVGAKDTWVPYEPTLERAVLPQVDDITLAARALVGY